MFHLCNSVALGFLVSHMMLDPALLCQQKHVIGARIAGSIPVPERNQYQIHLHKYWIPNHPYSILVQHAASVVRLSGSDQSHQVHLHVIIIIYVLCNFIPMHSAVSNRV